MTKSPEELAYEAKSEIERELEAGTSAANAWITALDYLEDFAPADWGCEEHDAAYFALVATDLGREAELAADRSTIDPKSGMYVDGRKEER